MKNDNEELLMNTAEMDIEGFEEVPDYYEEVPEGQETIEEGEYEGEYENEATDTYDEVTEGEYVEEEEYEQDEYDEEYDDEYDDTEYEEAEYESEYSDEEADADEIEPEEEYRTEEAETEDYSEEEAEAENYPAEEPENDTENEEDWLDEEDDEYEEEEPESVEVFFDEDSEGSESDSEPETQDSEEQYPEAQYSEEHYEEAQYSEAGREPAYEEEYEDLTEKYDLEDEESDDDEGEGSGVIWKILIGFAAVIVVALLVIIGYILHTKGLLFNKDSNAPGVEIVTDVGEGDLVTDDQGLNETDIDSSDQSGAGEDQTVDQPEQVTDGDSELDGEESEETDKKEYEEVSYENAVDVGLEAISILKDLKVKFTNKSTGKLIANIPFEVEVSYPDGTSKTWSDTDKDGIIYYTDLAAGAYTLKAVGLTDEKYKDYNFTGSKVAEVKEEIAYKAVEIADEVLDATQVDEGTEDTARNGADTGGQAEVITAGEVKDTVTFVESTRNDTYEEVDKSQIVITPASSVPAPSTNADTENNEKTENENGEPTGTDDLGEPSIKAESKATELAVGSVVEIGVTITNIELRDLTVTSSDDSIATAMLGMDGRVTITGVTGGKATVRIICLSSPEINDAIEVTVIGGDDQSGNGDGSGNGSGNSSGTAESNKLKFSDGSQVYVLDNGTYREAVKADYDTFTQFFRMKSSYTGWQTIGGSTYYYTSEGKAVTGKQIIQGKEYTFDDNGKLTSGGNDAAATGNSGGGTLGIDVSKWNGKIDWQKVHDAGIGYAIIRIGYRGSSKGSLIDDAKFATNIAGASAAGIKVGVYFFSQAVNEVEAVEEASMVIDRLKGYSIQLPVYLDVEASGGRGDKIDVATRTAVCRTFCQTIANAGYSAGIYANKNWLTEKINTGELAGYSIWVAHYNETCGYTGSYSMWQYTDKGTVDGISGNVDLDKVYF